MKRGHRIPLLAVAASIVLTLLAGGTAARAVPLPDYHEPNDSFATATRLENGVKAWGAITDGSDQDFFYLDLPASGQVTVEFGTSGYDRACGLAILKSGSDVISDLDWDRFYDDDGSFHAQGTAGPGRLFAVVSVGRGAPSTAAYTIEVTYRSGGPATFPDVPEGSAYHDAISYLAGKGVVSGYANGNFGPSDLVTRQQFAKMIVRAMGYAVTTNDICPFADVPLSQPGTYLDPTDPLYPDHYIAVAARRGITVGETATTFGPYDKITMAQVVTMVVRIAENEGMWDSPPSGYTPPFADFGPPHYANARIGAAHGLFTGYPGPWTWLQPATRGQCAFFIWKLMLAYALEGGGPQPVF